MLKTRIITASLLVTGLLITLFFVNHAVWSWLTLLVILLAATEWASLIRLTRPQALSLAIAVFLIGVFVQWMPHAALADYQSVVALVFLGLATVFWLLIAPFWLISRRTCEHALFMAALGVVLLIAAWLGVVGLRAENIWLLIGAIATVSLADSAAYFSGKRFGRHKLAPEISPGKTWEGVFGAVLAVTIYAVLLCVYLAISFWLIPLLWMVVVLSVIGDLVESLLKRQAGLKDSGHLLPGHGGILDRIDGFIPTLPLILLCANLEILSRLHING
ncbi:MAG: phosphatidate cytidylyltransferase [Betaproteobacteria bacterium HGW-Betaproteobacteria-22]|nr:MAG: phosphatidate cytidylyltransferase [Betaproteobacteria bacterium HGW-Betaproteobacteria-22]